MDKIGKTGHHGTGCYGKQDTKLPMGQEKNRACTSEAKN